MGTDCLRQRGTRTMVLTMDHTMEAKMVDLRLVQMGGTMAATKQGRMTAVSPPRMPVRFACPPRAVDGEVCRGNAKPVFGRLVSLGHDGGHDASHEGGHDGGDDGGHPVDAHEHAAHHTGSSPTSA